MVAKAVTTANTNSLINSARATFRGANGLPYVLSFYGTTIQLNVATGSVLYLNQTSTNGSLGSGSSTYGFAQSFVGDGKLLNKVSFELFQTATLTSGTITAKLYAHTGTFGSTSKPIGTPLASSTTTINASTITGTFTFYDFAFLPYKLISGTNYCISIEVTNVAPTAQLSHKNHTSDVASGNRSSLFNSTWTEGAGDLVFRVYTFDSNEMTSWTPYNLTSAGTILAGVSGAIDSSNVIHISWLDDAGAASKLKYCTFNCNTLAFSAITTINADIGNDPVNTSLYTAIAVDSNDIPHIVTILYPSVSGGATYSVAYHNKVGGAWNSVVDIYRVKNNQCSKLDIAIRLDNLPVITYYYGNSLYACLGNANNATSFTTQLLNSDVVTGIQLGSITIDKAGNIFVAKMNSVYDVLLFKHTYGAAWTTWTTYTNTAPTVTWDQLSIVSADSSIYIFYENNTTHDIELCIFNGSTFGTPVVLETGTFNTPITKWSYFSHNDSAGSHTIAGRADGSGTTEGAIEWVNPENIFDTDDTTVASINSIGTRFIKTGTSFTESDDINFPINQVILKVKQYTSDLAGVTQFRVYSGATLLADPTLTLTAQYITDLLDVPPGGWTWDKVKALRCAVYSGTGPPTIYVYKIDFIVLVGSQPIEIDYVFIDETATPDIWWNIYALVIPTLWLTKSLKWYNGSSWVAKPLKSYIGGSWQTKLTKRNM